MTFKVYIPARYASSRLPGKPLLVAGGQPIIQHVYENARDSGAQEVVIATDDEGGSPKGAVPFSAANGRENTTR